MAAPIKIAILADAGQAVKEVTKFRETTETDVKRVVTTLGDSKLTGGFGRAQEGFDVLDTRAMGFRDTLTGVQDSMRGFSALTTSTADATGRVEAAQKAYNAAVKKYGENSVQATQANTELAAATMALDQQQAPMIDKLFLMGTGVGDLASGFANFLIPALALMTPAINGVKIAMTALNLTFLTNPVFLIIAAIIALVAVFVIAYKKSETFRKIVDGAFKWVLNTVRSVWNWVKGNWPLLLAIITGPIGLATRWVVRNFDSIVSKVKSIPGKIKGAFSGAKDWLVSAGRNVVSGLWSGIKGMGGWLRDTLIGWAKSAIPGPIAKALGIASPSKVAMGLGGYFGQGLGIGLDRTRDSVQRAAGRLAAATVAAPPGGSSGGGTAGGGLDVVLSVERTGDALLDALLEQLRVRIRRNGGNVQSVLGSA